MFETPFYTNSHSSHGGDSFGSGCKNFCEFHNLNRDNIAFQNDVQSIPTRQNNAKYDVNAILRKAGYVIIGNENGDRSRSRNPAHKTNFPPNHHSNNPFFSQSIYDPSRYFNSPITDETSQILCTDQLFDQPADVSHTISTIPNSSPTTSKPIRLIDSEILLDSGVNYNPVGPNSLKNPNWIIITADPFLSPHQPKFYMDQYNDVIGVLVAPGQLLFKDSQPIINTLARLINPTPDELSISKVNPQSMVDFQCIPTASLTFSQSIEIPNVGNVFDIFQQIISQMAYYNFNTNRIIFFGYR